MGCADQRRPGPGLHVFESRLEGNRVAGGRTSRRQEGRDYKAIKVEFVECEAAVCKVRLTLTYDHRLMKGLMTPLSETWVIDEGKAWYVWEQ